ncbi:hypothetical protein CLV63_13317 [Murinocardiopsis flavida]|uniref:Membrane protein YeaQ/YmgE (Transglycosylase-associated protein family) n=1 Tax=Murinocardiopsis flavida TaxID=645275 RepID=A0A2P8CPM7_9ACTN|nr:GlsB/YeaQ/YmgE family stress response membrane protein [Murinocardiopsis flavida]PSK86900.1 hypothetical protein CLV63_13317 [Murinocardiopsis flavida]
MEITGIISALVVGLIIGAIARLIIPGKQQIPIWLTIVIGIVAAFLGGWVAAFFTTMWLIVLVVQILIAVAGVYLTAGVWGRSHH